MSGITGFFVGCSAFSLIVYSMTVPMPLGSGTEDDLTHTLSLLASVFFGGIAYLSYREDQ